MRLRSFQLVYLLLLLCSVQMLEARALGANAAMGVVASSTAESGCEHHARPTQAAAAEGKGSVLERRPAAAPATGMFLPGHQASAVAAFTSFLRV